MSWGFLSRKEESSDSLLRMEFAFHDKILRVIIIDFEGGRLMGVLWGNRD